jgi:DNA primase large subunit
MIRHDHSRVDHKRRANLDYKRRQFAKAEFQQQNYEHRLNFYVLPPTAEVTLDEFETWAINRLKGKNKQSVVGYVYSLMHTVSPLRA